jgi:ERCC4-type nuclease
MFTFSIDGREPPCVFNAFGEDFVHTRENLDVGDFQISQDGKPVVIAERKCWGDLISSLSGSRLSDQTARLVDKCRDTGARPLLVVESERVSDWEGKSGSLDNKFIDCCLHKYALEGISVIRTCDVYHTKNVMKWILARCEDDKVPVFQPTLCFRGEGGEKRYRRQDYANPWEAMLTSVRGVSKKKAKEISAKYANIREILIHFDSKKTMDIKGIGKKLETSIKEAFLGTS